VPLHYTFATAVYCVAIFWLSANPEPPGTDLGIAGADKAAHVVLFGGLGALVAVGMRRSSRDYGRKALFFVPVLFAGGYGVIDEIHQLWVPLRSFDPWDIAADVGGAMLAAWALLRWWPPVPGTPGAHRE
jgi:VanZ family protein